MGYSITEEQHKRLEALKAENRLCCMSTGRGGCFTRAQYEADQISWVYKIGEGKSSLHTMRYCTRHMRDTLESGGVNFRIIEVRKIDRMETA